MVSYARQMLVEKALKSLRIENCPRAGIRRKHEILVPVAKLAAKPPPHGDAETMLSSPHDGGGYNVTHGTSEETFESEGVGLHPRGKDRHFVDQRGIQQRRPCFQRVG